MALMTMVTKSEGVAGMLDIARDKNNVSVHTHKQQFLHIIIKSL